MDRNESLKIEQQWGVGRSQNNSENYCNGIHDANAARTLFFITAYTAQWQVQVKLQHLQ